MKREFKEEAYKLILKLELEGKIPENTILGKSVLDSAQGERMWMLIKALADSALKYEIKGISTPFYPNLQNYIQNPAAAIRSSVMRMKKSMILNIKKLAKDFNGNSSVLAAKQRNWAEHAKFLTLEHKNWRNVYDGFINKKNKSDTNTAMIEKLAALDRVPQIDMLKYIWRNIQNLIQASNERNGDYCISQIVDDSGKKRKIQGRPQENLETWKTELETVSAGLESGKSTAGLQNFTSQLKELITKYKQTQIFQLNQVKAHKAQLESCLNTIKNSNFHK